MDFRLPNVPAPTRTWPSRRRFLVTAGALLAVAGIAGCSGSRRQVCYKEGRGGQKRVLRATADCPDKAG